MKEVLIDNNKDVNVCIKWWWNRWFVILYGIVMILYVCFWYGLLFCLVFCLNSC